MATAGPKLELKGIDCFYGRTQVLAGVDLSMADGGFTAILGPNGCGKTTLFKVIARRVAPKSGSIRLNGRPITEYSSRDLAREVAVVAQESSIAFAFTAWEVVLMGRTPYLGRLQTESERDYEIVRGAMELTGTLPLRNRPITDLSGGEKQSVMIAQALAQESGLFILDEPTQHLDLSRQLEMMELLKRLNSEGTTIIVVLHDLNMAARYADTLALMKEGRVVGTGIPAELLTPQVVREVFDVSARVDIDEETGRVRIEVLEADLVRR